jgi:hypothetical protein
VSGVPPGQTHQIAEKPYLTGFQSFVIYKGHILKSAKNKIKTTK